MAATPKPVEFLSGGTICRGRLFEAENDRLQNRRGFPCVVMGHGFGGTMDLGLEPYAQRFAAAGLTVLQFDYRGFGYSDGLPRQLLCVRGQLDDWTAATAFARTLDTVDPSRVALWGASFAGGHVAASAVRDGSVAAIVSQCPMMDGLVAVQNLIGYAGLRFLMRLTGFGLVDQLRHLAGRPPYRLPVVGPPGSMAAMTTPDALPGIERIAPAAWRNEVCARIVLTMGLYRPGLLADRLPCPALIQICQKDSVAPARAAEAAVRLAGAKAEAKRYPIGHFDIYVGDAFEQAIADQVAFLTRVLKS